MSVRNLTNNQPNPSNNSSSGNDDSQTSSSQSNEKNNSHSSVEQQEQQRLLYEQGLAKNNPFNVPAQGEDINDDGLISPPYLSNDHNNNDNNYPALLSNSNNLEDDYRGYYSRNYSKNMGSPIRGGAGSHNDYTQPSIGRTFDQSNISHSNSTSNMPNLLPSEYDRYPSIVGSTIPSMQNINSTPLKKNTVSSSSFPIKDNSIDSLQHGIPFNGAKEWSPFGGYPASSFPLLMDEKEEDDFLHNADPEEEARLDKRRFRDDIKYMNKRTFGGFVGLLALILGGLVLFVVVPAITFTGAYVHPKHDTIASGNGSGGSGSGGSNEVLTSYKFPTLAAIRTNLVDSDTPSSAKTRKAKDGSNWQLVFSDEFNAEGRTFYDGDDQFWTAPDIHYDATKDLEWYSPDAVITKKGAVTLRMDAFKTHDLYYRSGMLQSWNKLCFTQGILEISANLPNYGRVSGLWPGLWTMGNLGRPGYLATTDGVWPYSYNACDAGITPNQSSPDGISYLPGQKLSACTCSGEDHPNPGTGRGAPEIDIIEAEADTTLGVGVASQSLQIAPFDIWYIPDYEFVEIYNFTVTTMNGYCGGPFQQAISAVTTLNTTWYEFGPEGGYFQKYSLEYLNDKDTGYIRWFVGDTPTFTLYSQALHPNGNIDWRQISQEPMSIIMNMGISNSWAYIDWQYIFFPVTMSIDYVRVYQPSDAISLTCDPTDYPTYDYIQDHLNAYSNANLTKWVDAGYSFPKNKLTGNCKV